MAIGERGPTDTNNRDDIAEMAEGFRQESAMHRFVFACLVLALMALGTGSEGQTTSSGKNCAQETDYSITPDIVENSEAFHLVVIGDSIAWGAGLETEKKYSYLVAEWLSKQLKRPVDVKILAHTGATIGETNDPVALSPDLSSGSPTLMEQANRISDPTHVDLILVSGGINDITVNEIIKLDHLETTMYDYLGTGVGPKAIRVVQNWKGTCSKEELRRKTGEIIKPLMQNFLNNLLANCPNAIIIVTGYYPIISEKSTGLTEAIKTLMPESQQISDYQKLDNNDQRKQLSDKSDAFYDESTKSLEEAVLETKSKRVAFAGIEFNPDNCYGTGGSFLWRIESGQTRTDDPLYECRVSLVGDGNGDKDRINKVAAVGHPNEKGAGIYFSAIKEEIEKISPEFLPKIEDFSILSPTTRALGDSFEIDYVVSDNGELGLKQVELWRTQVKDKWPESPENPIQTNTLSGETGPLPGSFTDSPPVPGKYWYGVHVVDNAGNWNDERNSNSNGQPSGFEPVEVEILGSAPPIVQAFQVAPRGLNLGESFAIDYTASDTGGSGLKQVELWRKDETSDWQRISTNALAGETGPVSGSFTDSPTAPGKYWYGVHVVDNAGNWNDEGNSNSDGQPSSFEPAEVEVKGSQEVSLNLYVHDGSADGPVLSEVGVAGQDASGKSFSHLTNENGLAVITGSPGSWQFTAMKDGYDVNSWSQEVAKACTKHAFLLAEESTAEDAANSSLICTLAGNSGRVESVSFSRKDGTLASGSGGNAVKLWDVSSKKEVATLADHSGWVNSVAFSPDGRTLASGCGEMGYAVDIWDVSSRTKIASLTGHSYRVHSVAFSPDGRILASGSGDATVKLWDVASRTEIATLEDDYYRPIVYGVAFSPDGQTLAAGRSDGTVKLWDVTSKTEVATLAGHTGWVHSVAFSPDGQTLASGGDDATVKLWDVTSGTEVATLMGHSKWVGSVAFSPDGRTLASGSGDGTVKLWDVASRMEVATLAGHSDSVESVAFSPDGRTLASGSDDTTIKLWDVA